MLEMLMMVWLLFGVVTYTPGNSLVSDCVQLDCLWHLSRVYGFNEVTCSAQSHVVHKEQC